MSGQRFAFGLAWLGTAFLGGFTYWVAVLGAVVGMTEVVVATTVVVATVLSYSAALRTPIPREAASARPTINLGIVPEKIKIARPPGHRVSRVLGLLFGSRAFRRVFGQIVADAHEEWVEAAKTGDEKALWVIKIAKFVGVIQKVSGASGDSPSDTLERPEE